MKKYISKFKENEKIILVKLITNEGKIINRKGYAEEGVGIFDNGGNEYITGYDKKGQIYALNVDENNYILNFGGDKTKYKI